MDSPISDTFYELFYQVMHHVAHTFNIELEEIQRGCRVVPAPEDIVLDQLADGQITIEKGTVAGIHLVWEGIPKDKRDFRVIKENIWVVRPHLPDFFPVEESGWEVEIEGRPSLNMQLQLVPSRDGSIRRSDCMVGAAIPVIPEVVAAPPGILMPSVFAPFKRHFSS